ncbi:MAG: type II CAAX prenyl endopeptidase Rce1 family protein [Pirellulales bacterium]
MLFLAKKRVIPAVVLLAVFAVVGLVVRRWLPSPTPIAPDGTALGLGVFAAAVMLALDGLLHMLGVRWGGAPYARRLANLYETFRGQTYAAAFAGALLAAGEEWIFRGLDDRAVPLALAALVFGLCHYLPRAGWLFAVWAVWEGVVLASVVGMTGNLAVSMTAHGVHDLAGFLWFRRRLG